MIKYKRFITIIAISFISIHLKVCAQSGPDYFIFKDSLYDNPIDAANLKSLRIPFKAKMRSYYFFQDLTTNKKEALALGGSLSWNPSIVSNHITGRVTLATSQRIYGQLERDGTMLLKPGQEGFTVLQEYALQFKKNKFLLNVGAREMNSPLLNTSDVRMLPATHRGIDINYLFKEDSYISFGVIDQIKWINSDRFIDLYEFAGFDRNELVWGTANRYKTDIMAFGLYYLNAKDYYHGLYTEYYREFSLKGNPIKIGIQYMHENDIGDGIGGDFNFNMLGTKLDFYLFGLKSFIGYTNVLSVDKAQEVWSIMPYYNMMIFNFFNRPKEQSVKLGVILKLSEVLNLYPNMGFGFTPNSGDAASPNQQEYNLTLDYTFLKDFNLKVRGAFVHQNSIRNLDLTSKDIVDFRVILNYKWSNKF
ncbi:OprD family outer membrane porin [Robiginitalea aurantiaca]|uniref:OprD family outer membrane porin n=1 Tax=Robiginitalea aurantiaca TaxID=3056915 RepID=A0ABT7WIU8_9FLAO|nr:OprD family outer membrane porin [Robiginitalea aurantiaca]MDM9632826.1 OprD family outer membrane porin [Robiginitalea aurantiaca]